jgi:signal transduction histidine kinase
MKSILDKLRGAGQQLTDANTSIFWAIVIGLLLTQGRDATRQSNWELVIIAVQLVVLRLYKASPIAAYVLSAATQLAACAYGVSPTIAIGALVVCAAEFQRVDTHGRGFVLDASLRAVAPLVAVSVLPWALHFRAGAVFTGAADAHSPWDTLILLIFATILRSNWNVVDTLLHGASRRAEEAEATKADAVDAERARIARELHDVVAHQMSVVVVQAQGARALIESDPDRAVAALDTISTTTREALVEMRRLVGVTQPEGAAPGIEPDEPQPGLTANDLTRLASTAEASGLDVQMRIVLDQAIPAGVALFAYRTIQESLTNAAKHAPGSEVQVAVAMEGTTLRVEVTNGPARTTAIDVPGSGAGLFGMVQRAVLLDGELEAGPNPGGGWSVIARFPTLEAPTNNE